MQPPFWISSAECELAVARPAKSSSRCQLSNQEEKASALTFSSARPPYKFSPRAAQCQRAQRLSRAPVLATNDGPAQNIWEHFGPSPLRGPAQIQRGSPLPRLSEFSFARARNSMMEISAGGPICGENQMSCLEQVAQRDKRLCAIGGKNGVLPEKEKEKNTLKKKGGPTQSVWTAASAACPCLKKDKQVVGFWPVICSLASAWAAHEGRALGGRPVH